MKNQLIYTIIFKDNTKYAGGISYFETKWQEISNKKIKRIFYRLPDGNHLCLSGYDKYYHMVEVVEDLNGKRKGEVRIEYVYIMGKKDSKVTSYRIALIETHESITKVPGTKIINNRYKLGDITRREFDMNSKFVKGLNKDFWRG